MRRFLILFVFGLHLSAGAALKCYNCQSTDSNDCTNLSKVQTVSCDPTRDALSPVCIRRVLQSTLGTNITLQCLYKSTGGECDPPSLSYNVTKCRLCQENLCNRSEKPYRALPPYQLAGFCLFSTLAKLRK